MPYKDLQKRKEYHKAYNKIYNKENKERFAFLRKRYGIENYEKIKKYQREYAKNKRIANPKLRLKHAMSANIRLAIKENKNGHHWEELVGYTLKDLIVYIEKQFKKGMTWDNYGEWQIDHKIPVSAFNFTKPEDIDFKRCWALKNLQPMWAKENKKKGDKLTIHFQPSLAFG